MFYGVYFYTPGSSSSVYLVGFYDNLDTAKQILNNIAPNYKPGYGNAVHGNGKIGWINKYEMNNYVLNPNKRVECQLACNQPHSSVNLFGNEDLNISIDE